MIYMQIHREQREAKKETKRQQTNKKEREQLLLGHRSTRRGLITRNLPLFFTLSLSH